VPTLNLVPQRNGANSGWSSLVGGTVGYDTVDDGVTTVSDGDASYLILPRLVGSGGIVSFGFFGGAERILPTSISIRAAVKKNTGNPEIEVGFFHGGAFAFSAATIIPGATYNTVVTTFANSPFTAAPWTAGSMSGLEPCLRMKAGVIGTARVSLLNVVLDYAPLTSSRYAGRYRDGAAGR
jgi:hypothetical protein